MVAILLLLGDFSFQLLFLFLSCSYDCFIAFVKP